MSIKRDVNRQQRMMQLELICQWEGRLSNARLRELFGIRTVRASEWMREFREEHPRWTEWDSTTRSYHATREAYRTKQNAEGRSSPSHAESLTLYLTLVGLPPTYKTAQVFHAAHAAYSAFPDLSTPRPRIFAGLSAAIRAQQTVEITYRSMREPEPHARTISPHTIVRAGRRWHVRAYCAKNKDFQDYALGRIVDVKLLGKPADKTEEDDHAWMTQVPVRIIAHPGLTMEQEALIRFEYFDNTAALVQTCRGPLVNYFIQDIRAAVDTQTQRPPDYQLAVFNVEEIAPWLFPI